MYFYYVLSSHFELILLWLHMVDCRIMEQRLRKQSIHHSKFGS